MGQIDGISQHNTFFCQKIAFSSRFYTFLLFLAAKSVLLSIVFCVSGPHQSFLEESSKVVTKPTFFGGLEVTFRSSFRIGDPPSEDLLGGPGHLFFGGPGTSSGVSKTPPFWGGVRGGVPPPGRSPRGGTPSGRPPGGGTPPPGDLLGGGTPPLKPPFLGSYGKSPNSLVTS